MATPPAALCPTIPAPTTTRPSWRARREEVVVVLSDTNLVLASIVSIIIGLLIWFMPSLLPLLVAITLVVLGLVGLYAGLTHRRVF